MSIGTTFECEQNVLDWFSKQHLTTSIYLWKYVNYHSEPLMDIEDKPKISSRSVEMKNLLALARTPEEFSNQIQRELNGDNPLSQQARKEEVTRHRWSTRAERLLAWLQAN